MFTLIMEYIYRQLLKYDESWCDMMGIFNPYTDPFDVTFSQKVPMFDRQAYNMFPKYNFVYDKLWVCKSQNLKCGTLESLYQDNNTSYPVFIKPRWGHLSASSKNCFKVKSYEELLKYKDLKDMMWSEYIDGQEYMTDYVLLNGVIIYKISYLYSKDQFGYIEKYKYISPGNESIPEIDTWVNEYMVGYSGIVNVQMRDNKIIEVGLRPARGGAYIQSTNNIKITEMINYVYEKNIDIVYNPDTLDFKPYYSFKCFTRVPFFYIFPQYFIDFIMYIFGCKNFMNITLNLTVEMVWYGFNFYIIIIIQEIVYVIFLLYFSCYHKYLYYHLYFIYFTIIIKQKNLIRYLLLY